MPGVVVPHLGKPNIRGRFASGLAPQLAKYPQLWKGCVGAWSPGLGPQGVTLVDHSGNANHGTLTNMDPATDYLGGALDFDGTNDYVAFNYDFGNVYKSISFWMRFSSDGHIILNLPGASGFFQMTATDFVFQRKISNVWNYLQVAKSSSDINNGQFHSVAVVDTSAGTWLYIDGMLVDSDASAYHDHVSGTFQLGSPTVPFGGAIDDIRIYDRALSHQEIALLARRRNIAYELAPRYYSLPGAAAVESRQSLTLLGVG